MISQRLSTTRSISSLSRGCFGSCISLPTRCSSMRTRIVITTVDTKNRAGSTMSLESDRSEERETAAGVRGCAYQVVMRGRRRPP